MSSISWEVVDLQLLHIHTLCHLSPGRLWTYNYYTDILYVIYLLGGCGPTTTTHTYSMSSISWRLWTYNYYTYILYVIYLLGGCGPILYVIYLLGGCGPTTTTHTYSMSSISWEVVYLQLLHIHTLCHLSPGRLCTYNYYTYILYVIYLLGGCAPTTTTHTYSMSSISWEVVHLQLLHIHTLSSISWEVVHLQLLHIHTLCHLSPGRLWTYNYYTYILYVIYLLGGCGPTTPTHTYSMSSIPWEVVDLQLLHIHTLCHLSPGRLCTYNSYTYILYVIYLLGGCEPTTTTHTYSMSSISWEVVDLQLLHIHTLCHLSPGRLWTYNYYTYILYVIYLLGGCGPTITTQTYSMSSISWEVVDLQLLHIHTLCHLSPGGCGPITTTHTYSMSSISWEAVDLYSMSSISWEVVDLQLLHIHTLCHLSPGRLCTYNSYTYILYVIYLLGGCAPTTTTHTYSMSSISWEVVDLQLLHIHTLCHLSPGRLCTYNYYTYILYVIYLLGGCGPTTPTQTYSMSSISWEVVNLQLLHIHTVCHLSLGGCAPTTPVQLMGNNVGASVVCSL